MLDDWTPTSVTLLLATVQAVATVVLVIVTVWYVKLTSKIADAGQAEANARRSSGQLDALRAAVSACVELEANLTNLRISAYQGGTWPNLAGVIDQCGEIRASQAIVARREAEIPEALVQQWHAMQPDILHLTLGSVKLAAIAAEHRREHPEATRDALEAEYKKYREAGEVEWEDLDSGTAHAAVVEALRRFRLAVEAAIRAISAI